MGQGLLMEWLIFIGIGYLILKGIFGENQPESDICKDCYDNGIKFAGQGDNYFENSKKFITKIDKLNKSYYIKFNNKSLDSAVNSLINHKNGLIKDVENHYL